MQRLRVGVGDDEFTPIKILVNHVVDGIAACPTDTKHGDTRFHLRLFRERKVKCHECFRLFL